MCIIVWLGFEYIFKYERFQHFLLHTKRSFNLHELPSNRTFVQTNKIDDILVKCATGATEIRRMHSIILFETAVATMIRGLLNVKLSELCTDVRVF